MGLYVENNKSELHEKHPVNMTLHYPRDDEYDYFVRLAVINLDEECKKDLANGKGFVITDSQNLNTALKSETSIFSSKFGRTLQDENPYAHRFSCKCGATQGAFYAVPNNEKWVCPYCRTEVKMVGDDFTFFGWIILSDHYRVISPIMYMELCSLIGKDNLENILEPSVECDTNGNPLSAYDRKLMRKKNARRYKKNRRRDSIDSTYEAIGMMGFYEKFDEIIEYFYKKKKTAKQKVYEFILEHKDCVFTHSIPVYTTQLRIAKVEAKRFTFEKTNASYNIMAKLAATINRDNLSIYRNLKLQNQLLWDIQEKFNDLSDEIIRILAGKKGVMRSTISGRTSFSERTVIVPDSTLRIDEISLPYAGLVFLLEQILVNILQSSYNITYAAAYKMWYYASLKVDQRVLDIINGLIAQDKIHAQIGRNPTIWYHSTAWKRVVKVNTDSLVMGMDLFCLKGLNADFDGDTLNIKLILSEQYDKACEAVYSPRNNFCISRNDGLFNLSICIFKDLVINTEALIHMTRKHYSQEQLDKIHMLQEKYKNVI